MEEKRFTGGQALAKAARAMMLAQPQTTSTNTRNNGPLSTMAAAPASHVDGQKPNRALHLMGVAAATSDHHKYRLRSRKGVRALNALQAVVQPSRLTITTTALHHVYAYTTFRHAAETDAKKLLSKILEARSPIGRSVSAPTANVVHAQLKASNTHGQNGNQKLVVSAVVARTTEN